MSSEFMNGFSWNELRYWSKVLFIAGPTPEVYRLNLIMFHVEIFKDVCLRNTSGDVDTWTDVSYLSKDLLNASHTTCYDPEVKSQTYIIAPDKNCSDELLILLEKHMLWVLLRSALL